MMSLSVVIIEIDICGCSLAERSQIFVAVQGDLRATDDADGADANIPCCARSLEQWPLEDQQ